jgi:hypothetical protein
MSIVDRREIEFDCQAVKRAIQWSPKAARAFGLPTRVPDAVRCNPTEGTAEVLYGKHVYGLRSVSLGALLMAYCNRTGMPMARHSGKSIRIEPHHVVLVLTLRLDEARQPDIPENNVTPAPESVQAWSWIEPVS